MSRHVFGPVPSRRLGFSLGVDIIPAKYCSFDCIYCQIGKTTHLEVERMHFFDTEEIIDEVIASLEDAKRVDFVTFSGSGEPTLNSDLGLMIREIKRRANMPVAVITNGSLLYKKDVRDDLMEADVILPSLDAASEDIFRYINRPHPFLDLDIIVTGLKEFRKNYKGQIWLEIMMLRDVNDDPDELAKLKDVIDDLGVDKVQLNTVVRPPSEQIRGTMGRSDLERVCRYFGPGCEVVCAFEGAVEFNDESPAWEERVIEILKRRSMNLDDIVKITGLPLSKVKSRLSRMEYEGLVKSYSFEECLYYMNPQQD